MSSKKTSSTLADKARRPRAKATPEQGPEYQKLLDEAAERNVSMAEVRGVPSAKVPKSQRSNTGKMSNANPNPSPATRLKPGESPKTLKARKEAEALAALAKGPKAQAPKAQAPKKQVPKDRDKPVNGTPPILRKEPNWAQHAIDAAERKRLAKEAGMTPLEFMLSIMCDSGERIYIRMDAAKLALPYFHRKMPIAIDNGAGGPVGVYTKEQLARLSGPELQVLESLMVKLSSEFAAPIVPASAATSPAALLASLAPDALSQMEPHERDKLLIMAQASQAQSLEVGTGAALTAAKIAAATEAGQDDES